MHLFNKCLLNPYCLQRTVSCWVKHRILRHSSCPQVVWSLVKILSYIYIMFCSYSFPGRHFIWLQGRYGVWSACGTPRYKCLSGSWSCRAGFQVRLGLEERTSHKFSGWRSLRMSSSWRGQFRKSLEIWLISLQSLHFSLGMTGGQGWFWHRKLTASESWVKKRNLMAKWRQKNCLENITGARALGDKA